LIIPVLLSPLTGFGPRAEAAPPPTESRPASILGSLTPEERVGQLFLVTFDGGSAAPGTPVYELVTHYHVGGVLLRAASGNFTPGVGEAAQVQALSGALQQAESDSAQFPIVVDSERGRTQIPTFIPLFVAAQQDGDGFPGSQWTTDLTQLPSEMAIGATWDPALAESAGQVCGKELAALGVNLLLGPSLDVLERPNPGTPGDLGAAAFGGDPFWVGQMGSAYIQGVHEGSRNQVAVVATHFPGIGGSDRDPEAEVATVQKALDQLEQIDLAPFFAVTNGNPGQEDVTDGLLVTPLRYEGLQGNLRETSLPLSLDPQALGQLLGLPQISPWREAGGLTVSDSLGAESVRRFYDPTETTFPGRQVARDALLAGNDLLLLGDYKVPGLPDETAAIEDTIGFFVQKYKTDPAFAQDVNQALLRILTLKARLYPQFTLATIQPSLNSLAEIGTQEQVAFNIEKAASTLLSPASQPGAGQHALEPPTLADHIIFFTDAQIYHPCSACKTTPLIPVDALQSMVVRLYGPNGSDQIDPTHLHSYSFADLEAYLNGTNNPSLDSDLGASSWIVVLLLSPSQTSPGSTALSDLLSERADLLPSRKVVVFAMDAPYYLDSTEISKLSAYYALYSKVPAAIEVAARTLFGELTPYGDSPVSIDGLGYDLVAATSPDPNQILPVSVVAPGPGKGTATPTAAASPASFKMGDTLVLQAGPVLDENHHIVPDGTVVTFSFAYPAAGIPALTVTATTHEGVAEVSHVLDRNGALEMRASSQPAMRSTIIDLQVGEKPGFVTAIAPTPEATITAVPTPSPIRAAPTPTPRPAAAGPQGISFSVLISTLVFLGFLSAGGMWLLTRVRPGYSRRRSLLGLILGGLAGYDFVALGLSGIPWAKVLGLDWAGVLMTFLGTAIAFGLLWVVPVLIIRFRAGQGRKEP
jgi:beta-N-acetylhexosaminidase